MEPSTERQSTRYGWVDCASCKGSGTTRRFQGNSATMLHLARGGNPTEMPCGQCRGNRRVWTELVEVQSAR